MLIIGNRKDDLLEDALSDSFFKFKEPEKPQPGPNEQKSNLELIASAPAKGTISIAMKNDSEVIAVVEGFDELVHYNLIGSNLKRCSTSVNSYAKNIKSIKYSDSGLIYICQDQWCFDGGHSVRKYGRPVIDASTCDSSVVYVDTYTSNKLELVSYQTSLPVEKSRNFGNNIRSLDISANWIVLACSEIVAVYDTDFELIGHYTASKPVTKVTFHPQDGIGALSENLDIIDFDDKNKMILIDSYKHPNMIDFAFSPSGKYVAILTKEDTGKIHVLEVKDGNRD